MVNSVVADPLWDKCKIDFNSDRQDRRCRRTTFTATPVRRPRSPMVMTGRFMMGRKTV
jgi:hypothetical protein